MNSFQRFQPENGSNSLTANGNNSTSLAFRENSHFPTKPISQSEPYQQHHLSATAQNFNQNFVNGTHSMSQNAVPTGIAGINGFNNSCSISGAQKTSSSPGYVRIYAFCWLNWKIERRLDGAYFSLPFGEKYTIPNFHFGPTVLTDISY